MPIDRQLYEKYTGRLPGDAQTRLGESLAKRTERLEGMKSWSDRSFSERYFIVGLGWEVLTLAMAGVVGLIALIYALLF